MMSVRKICAVIGLAVLAALSWVSNQPDDRLIRVICMTAMLVIYCLPDDDGGRR